jgi:hypothetical protein
MTKRITFGDLNASHAGATVIINDGRQILRGTIDTIAHYLDQGVTGISLKGHRLAVQRAHTWPVTISKPATTVDQ